MILACAALGLLALPIAGSVAPVLVGIYIAYLLVFVLGPGVLIVTICTGSQRGLAWLLAVGIATGYAVELMAFWFTALINQRGLFITYPILVVLAGATYWATQTRRRFLRRPSIGRVELLTVVVGAAIIALIVVSGYSETPLPGNARLAYSSDISYHLSLAADAKHHWPLALPWIVGHSLHYHWFLYGHLAAASQVTGIQIPILFFRIDLPVLLFVACLQIAVLASLLTERRGAGALSLAFCLVLGGLNFAPESLAPFNNYLFEDLYRSPTFLYGLVFFLAALIVGLEILQSPRRARRPWLWVLLALVLFGCAGAKVTILPILVGGTILMAVHDLLGVRRVPMAVWGLLGIGFLALAGAYLTIYVGGGSGLHIAPLRFVTSTLPATILDGAFPAAVGLPLRVVESGLWASVTFIPLVGIALGRRVGWLPNPGARWMLWIFAASLACTLTVSELGQSEAYFLMYGYIGVGVVSAIGMAEWCSTQVPRWNPTRHTSIITLACASTLVLTQVQPIALKAFRFPLVASKAAPYLILGVAVAALAVYGSWRRSFSTGALYFATLILLFSSALNTLFTAGTAIGNRSAALGSPGFTADGMRLVTPPLADGLNWLRDNTPSDTLVAVNNHFRDAAHTDSRMFIYSAFSERRFFLETWALTEESLRMQFQTGLDSPNPYPALLTLNDSAFASPEDQSLQILRRKYHVRYLFIDKLGTHVSPSVYRHARFSNSEVAIVDLSE